MIARFSAAGRVTSGEGAGRSSGASGARAGWGAAGRGVTRCVGVGPAGFGEAGDAAR